MGVTAPQNLAGVFLSCRGASEEKTIALAHILIRAGWRRYVSSKERALDSSSGRDFQQFLFSIARLLDMSAPPNDFLRERTLLDPSPVETHQSRHASLRRQLTLDNWEP